MNELKDDVSVGQDAKRLIKIRPTVFIGLGGTGKEVLLRIRRRILNESWNGRRLKDLAEFPVASFLYFDLDTVEGRESDKSVQSDPLANMVAFLPAETLQKKVNLSEYTNELDRYPLIKEWWPKAAVDRVVKEAEKGAGQIRPISRLQFFALSPELRGAIRTKAQEVTSSLNLENALQSLGLRLETKALRVVVVTSTAGGTGSGSFLDLGYLVRGACPQAHVDLLLLLAGGYETKNKERVFANTYAALKELEYGMRGNKYVERWTNFDSPVTVKTPYNEVYLLDNANISGERTRNLEDIYNMMADTLFEDLGNGEFADQKRSVSVNQQQHKIGGYRPFLGTSLGEKPLSYEKVYSSFGQSILDTQGRASLDIVANKSCIEMIRAFFQIAGDEESNVPSPEKVSEFMKNNLLLAKTVFEDFPKGLTVKPTPIHECALVDELLKISGLGSILVQVEDNIKSDFTRITQDYSEHKDWLQGIGDVANKRVREVCGDPGAPEAALREKQIKDSREKLFKQWSSDRGVKQLFFSFLDDKERGGLDYTIALIEQIKDSIGNHTTGIIKTLQNAQSEYLKLANIMWKDRYLPAIENFKQTFGFDPLGTKKKQAEIILMQIADDLNHRLKYLLREMACKQAVIILNELSSLLGEKMGLDDQGEPVWNGLVREFLDGRAAVKATMALLDDEVQRLQEACNRTDGMYIIMHDEDSAVQHYNADEAKGWAGEAFENYGGSKRLFEMLKEKSGRYQLINNLYGFAVPRIINNVERELSFVRAFKKLTRDEQKEKLKMFFSRAMPWLDIDITGHFSSTFTSSQYKCLVAVNEKDQFAPLFNELLPQVIPEGLISPELYETSVKGRMVCYVELSGVPLDVIKPLKIDWKTEYAKLIHDGLPLHNHKDWTRYPDPLIPTSDEIEHIIANMQLFLEGVVFGVLRRKRGEDGYYEVQVEPGRWQGAGNERRIRALGFDAGHRDIVERDLRDLKEKISTPWQMLALKVLFSHFARRSYAPTEILDGTGLGQEFRGLGSIQADALAAHWLERFKRHGAEIDQDTLEKKMGGTLSEWADDIPGSVFDVDSSEVDIKNASPKLAVKQQFFTKGWIEGILDVEAGEKSATGPETRPKQTAQAGSAGEGEASLDPAERLMKIKKLYDMGVLNQEEYEQKRAELIKLL